MTLSNPTARGALPSRPGRRTGPIIIGEQFCDRNAQGGRQRVNHRERRIGLTRLDAAHVGAEQSTTLGEILLRHPMLRAQGADPGAEGSFR